MLDTHWLTPALRGEPTPAANSRGNAEASPNTAKFQPVDESAKRLAANAFDRLPLRFEEREDSANALTFVARAGELGLRITPTGATLRLRAIENSAAPDPTAPPLNRVAGAMEQNAAAPRSKAGGAASLRMQLVGANRGARLVGGNQLSTRTNHFVGDDPQRWRTDIRNYARVKVEQAYRGIDVVYYGSGGRLEYDFNAQL